MTIRRRSQQGSRLFALYVLASLLPISAIGILAVRGDAASAELAGLSPAAPGESAED